MTGLPADLPVERFVLRARLPIRPLLVASSSAVVGAVLLVLGAARSWTVVLVLGVVLLVFAAALLLTALWAIVRLHQDVVVDDQGVTLHQLLRRRTVPWSAITRVTLAGAALTLEPADAGALPIRVLNPGGPSEVTFTELLEALQRRLDHDRGYRPLG